MVRLTDRQAEIWVTQELGYITLESRDPEFMAFSHAKV